ncbi:DUF4157 domain-containing protein [Paenibacillus sp. PL2-23]|uniref:eCIS core domain-containing protein n=1 Tax=Paenibacillus sp. PL2-23 TaxID=2100729 RepID=UPI0030FD0C73
MIERGGKAPEQKHTAGQREGGAQGAAPGRERTAPGAVGQLIQLQKVIGNRAVAQLLASGLEQQERPEYAAQLSAGGNRPPRSSGNSGLPDAIRAGTEGLSGMDLGDVRVHYNSDKPGQLDALAYAQGNDIHLGPGQEKHLPHEAWHVVQQRQGRVQPTVQLKDVAINEDEGLEREADLMGDRAQQLGVSGAAAAPVVQQPQEERLPE